MVNSKGAMMIRGGCQDIVVIATRHTCRTLHLNTFLPENNAIWTQALKCCCYVVQVLFSEKFQ